MKNWKKNLMAAGLLVVVCAGIYMNWMYSNAQQTSDLTDLLDAEKVLSADGLVLDAEQVSDNDGNNTVTDYFAAVRLSRQDARDRAVSLLQETMAVGSEEEMANSNDMLEQIVQMALSEAQIESLVIAKGYADCVAYMSEDGISVAVAAPEGGITQQDAAIIADIVMSQTDFQMQDIRVVEVQ